MKLKKIETLCKASGSIFLYNQTLEGGEAGEQWLGDGFAAYPLYGLPYMEMQHIVNLFGLSDKETDKMTLRQEEFPAGISAADSVPGEICVAAEPFSIICGGTELLPVTMPDGSVVFVQDRYYQPLRLEKDDAELWLRRSAAGSPYFAVKSGLMIAGILLPYISGDEAFRRRLGAVAANMQIRGRDE